MVRLSLAKYSSKWKSVLKRLDIPEEAHVEFMVAHAHAFEAVALLINKEYDNVVKEVYKKSNYESPNWSHRQADLNGSIRMLVELKQLLED
mgnify:CR=1 FL=1